MEHISNFASDHIMSPFLVLKLINSMEKGKGFWRINSSLLYNEETINAIQTNISLVTEIIDQGRDPYKIWLRLKQTVKEILQQHANQKAAKLKRERKRLEKNFNFSKRQMLENPEDENFHIAHSNAAYALKDYTQAQLTFGAYFSKARYFSEGDRVTKYQMSKINVRSPTIIPTLIDDEEMHKSSISDMKLIVQSYYEKLFTPDPSDNNIQENFLSAIQNRLSAEESMALKSAFTAKEIEEVISNTKGGSCPGIDGISIELYKKFKEDIAKILCCTFNFLVRLDSIPEKFTKGAVTLIFKKGDPCRIRNYCPITLLNADYKIMTKIIALRIKRVCTKLVGPTQFAFLSNRQVSDSVMATQLAISTQIKKEEPGFIVSLDNEKAYNRTLHNWIWKTLKAFNFPVSLITTVKKLYLNATSCFLINGHLTDSINQRRGVRQGDALSCYLFILAMASLVEKINQSREIRGFKCLKDNIELKVLAYADDLLIFVRDNASIAHLIELLSRFQLASNV